MKGNTQQCSGGEGLSGEEKRALVRCRTFVDIYTIEEKS
jgi:hypothetical protein